MACKISLKRISNFLSEDELDKYITRNNDTELALEIKDKAKFVWEMKDENSYENDISLEDSEKKKKGFELKDIELKITKGEFFSIIGKVRA